MPTTTDADAGAQFERLRPRLTAISRRIVGSDAEAEDVVQDCYLKWHGADRAALATPVAWLTTVVQRQSIDRLRQRTRDAAALAIAAQDEAVPPALPEDDLLRRGELAEALARLLDGLAPGERLAIVLREVFECSHADIAAVLGTTAVAARQRLARARRRLSERADAAHAGAPDAAAAGARHCRALVLRFQAAINGLDVAEMVALLADGQPVSVAAAAQPRMRSGPCANDACYRIAA